MSLHWAGFSSTSARTYIPECMAIKKGNSVRNNGLRPTESNSTQQRGNLISKVRFGKPVNARCKRHQQETELGFQRSYRVLNPLALELHSLPPNCCLQLMLPELSDSQSVAGVWEVILEGILWLGWAAACCRTWLWFSLIRIQIWKPFKEKSVWIVMFFLAFHSLLFHLCVCWLLFLNKSIKNTVYYKSNSP